MASPATIPPIPRIGARELGSTGLNRFAGIITEEFLPELQGTRATKIYREMRDNDPIVGAVLFAVEMLIRKVDWHVQPASNSSNDVAAALFVDQCRMDMAFSWEDTIAGVLSFMEHGWALHEIIYKMRQGPKRRETFSSRFTDGRIGWRKFPIRAQDTLEQWVFDEDSGEVEAMIQIAPPHFERVVIPIDRALHFRTTVKKENPEGRSVLRNAYRPWLFKKRIEEVEGIGIERGMAGLPVAWVPPRLLDPNASAEDKALKSTVETIVQSIRRDSREGIVYPMEYDESGNKLWDLSLLASASRQQHDTSEIINRYSAQMAMTVLADFILMGHQNVGSFALSNDKTNMFSSALGAWLDAITAVFNRQAIPRLFALNGITLEDTPQIVHGDVENVDLAALGDFIVKLASSGAALFPDDRLENELRAMGKLPPKDPNAESRPITGDPDDGMNDDDDPPPEPEPEPEPEPDPET